MENDIGDLRRLGSTLLLLAQTEGLEDVVQDGLHHVARTLLDCHRDVHDKFKRLFDQIVRADTDTPEPSKPAAPVTCGNASEPLPDDPETRWRELHGRWLAMQAEWAAGDPEQDRADQLTMEEGPLVLAMAATPVPRRFLAEKLEVLNYVMFHETSSSWIDRRDELLLNSIKADVKALG